MEQINVKLRIVQELGICLQKRGRVSATSLRVGGMMGHENSARHCPQIGHHTLFINIEGFFTFFVILSKLTKLQQ